jgi:O-antigen biosynthesis protein
MTPEIMQWARAVREKWQIRPKRVLEIGARDLNGTTRSIFQPDAEEYIGIDLDPGPGVDVAGDAVHHLAHWFLDPNGMNPFDLVICTETLEHAKYPQVMVFAMREFLAPGGFMILTSPAQTFPEHHYPRDYWRIMPNAYEDIFFAGMTVLEHHTTTDPCQCWLGRM